MTNKYSIIALASIAVIGVFAFGMLSNTDSTNDIDPNKVTAIYTSQSYTTVDKHDMKKISDDIIEGEIINKYQIVQYRDADGKYVKEKSKKIAETEPYIVYELLTTEVIKNKKIDTKTYTFKTFGGEFNGVHVYTEVPEFEIGDHVVVFLEPSFDGKHHEITSGEFGIYKITNGKAKNANSEVSVKELKDSLR